MGDSGESDDDLCEYEKKRMENIRKNHGMLRSLGTSLQLYISV